MPAYLVGRVFDPILGLATGVMAYFLWENDGRNAHERPEGRSLPELVQRRLSNQPPPADLYAGPAATQRSLFHIPSASQKSAATTESTDGSRSTSQIIEDAKKRATQNQGEQGSDLRALRTAIADEWNQSSTSNRP
ncbi:hypothetical protein NDA16_003005 [Ustilago loliicola]|nr:hypothetical protein NDA16_003005 [Ustilago loliicola]